MSVWSYPNPFKDDHDELCDVIAVFDDHVFLFFDRESLRLTEDNSNFDVQWARWKRKVVEDQIRAVRRAELYIKSGQPVFLDPRGENRLPVEIPRDARIHKFIVAHGAKEACKAYSSQNVTGSLGISYEDCDPDFPTHDHLPPFVLKLDRRDKIHVLDSENIEIIFGELDTIFDLTQYVTEKEAAIDRYEILSYCGEEDLLCEYLNGYSEHRKRYVIGPEGESFNGVMIPEGSWSAFRQSAPYRRRAEANRVSYLWDNLIQRTCENALSGTIEGNADLPAGPSAIREMAREPRFMRRAISEGMIKAIKSFPEGDHGLSRFVSLMPSFYPGVKYVFLQLYVAEPGDYAAEYRPKRQRVLEIACAAAKDRWPELKRVVGIAIDAPKYHRHNSEDFILMNEKSWTDEAMAGYREDNRIWRFFASEMRETKIHVTDFPQA